MERNRVGAESYPNSQILKEGSRMTNLKFSRKRSVRALGLVALGLVLLVGSAEYGNADFGRTGGEPSIMTVAQEEQEPATFEVEAVVNARGGLEVRLTAIPGSPTLSIQFMVRGDTNPHRLVDPGTLIYILGIAKEGVTAFRSADDIASLMFFATVPSATAASTDSTMQGPTSVTFLFAELTTLILGGGQIRTPQNKVLLLQEDRDSPTWTPPKGYFGCCERNLELVRIVPPDKERRLETTPVGRRVEEKGNTVITITFDVAIRWECKGDVNPKNLCRGAFTALVRQSPGAAKAPKPIAETISVTRVQPAEAEDKPCEEQPREREATVRVEYQAKYEGTNVDVRAGSGREHLVIDIFVSDETKSRQERQIVRVKFDTTERSKDKERKGRFPITVDLRRFPPPPKKK
jgi:hypothetical protein